MISVFTGNFSVDPKSQLLFYIIQKCSDNCRFGNRTYSASEEVKIPVFMGTDTVYIYIGSSHMANTY